VSGRWGIAQSVRPSIQSTHMERAGSSFQMDLVVVYGLSRDSMGMGMGMGMGSDCWEEVDGMDVII
jgi:hypothetical protein